MDFEGSRYNRSAYGVDFEKPKPSEIKPDDVPFNPNFSASESRQLYSETLRKTQIESMLLHKRKLLLLHSENNSSIVVLV